MNIPHEVAAQRYQMARDEVRAHNPEIWNGVIKLCAAVPDRIEAAHIWQFGRDKPCWSNIKVKIGEKIASDMSRSTDFNSHETIASDSWEIVMRQRGRQWKNNDNFELRGEAVNKFINGLPSGGLASYRWKMYAIRNLALSLSRNSDARIMANNLSQRDRIPASELKEWTKSFSNLVGMGWGAVTAYHMLADLGLAPKPDIHLKRAAIRMGLLAPEIPSDYPEELIDELNDHVVVPSVMELSELIEPTAYPQKPRSALREVDKVLMEWSRQKLARPLCELGS